MLKIENKILKELFKSNYLEIKDDELSKLEELAKPIIDNNPWDEVYGIFDNYLRNECKTEDDVINYVYFFVDYCDLNFIVPSQYDPYDLVGYIYSMVDLEKRWDDCGAVFDDFANQALRIDLYNDPWYQFWRDPKIIAISEKYKEKRNDK